jgi:microcystin-dependent protein
MSQPYVGEIRMFAGNFPPAGWMFCEGQVLPISENDALFSLIGTTYGGDGQSTFALPDLRGRVPLHQGSGYVLSEAGGAEAVTLTTNQLPAHGHAVQASRAAATAAAGPSGVLAATKTALYDSEAPDRPMAANAVTGAGGSQPHDNMAPFLALSFIISLYGIYPSPF